MPGRRYSGSGRRPPHRIGVGSYYADSAEGPGRWLGAGAGFRKLAGPVDREAFTRILEGRDPRTGARLVTAQGSSQRGHLAVGTAARFDANGQALYTVADAARLLGVRRREMQDLVDAGRRPGSHDAGEAGWVASVDDRVDGVLIGDDEITRLQEIAASPIDVSAIRGCRPSWRSVDGHRCSHAAACCTVVRAAVVPCGPTARRRAAYHVPAVSDAWGGADQAVSDPP